MAPLSRALVAAVWAAVAWLLLAVAPAEAAQQLNVTSETPWMEVRRSLRQHEIEVDKRFTFGVHEGIHANATNPKEWLYPVIQMALHFWQSKTILPAPTNVYDIVYDAWVLDTCQAPGCSLSTSIADLMRLALGNLSMANTWTPVQAMVSGEHEAYTLNSLAQSLEVAVVGFDSDIVDFGQDQEANFLFVRVNSNRVARAEILVSLADHLINYNLGYPAGQPRSPADPATVVALWSCNTAYHLEQWVSGYQIAATARGIPMFQGALLADGADTHVPPAAGTLQQLVWLGTGNARAIQDVHLHFYAFLPRDACPAFDFMHFMFPFLVGKGFLWMSAYPINTADYDQYRAEARSQGSPYARVLPYDGMLSISRSETGTVWDNFKTWYDTNVAPNPAATGLFSTWMLPSLPADSSGFQVPQVPNAFDAIWVLLRAMNEVLSVKGFNFTGMDVVSFLRQNSVFSTDRVAEGWTSPLEFVGMTGRLAFQRTGDRSGEYDVLSYRRNAAECSMDRVACNLQTPLSLAQWEACMLAQPDQSGAAAYATTTTKVWKEIFENPALALTQLFGCQTGSQVAFQDLVCVDGSYYDAPTHSCLLCPAGTSDSSDGRVCAPCTAGRYQPTEGLAATRCLVCPRGRFAKEPRAAECTQCQPGKFLRGEGGGDECQDCAVGQFTDKIEASGCDFCPRGRYQQLTGQPSCTICPASYSTQVEGSGSASLCQCEPGFYDGDTVSKLPSLSPSLPSNASLQCIACADQFKGDNVKCDGWGEPPMVERGFMTLTGQTEVYDCYYKSDDPDEKEACPSAMVGTSPCHSGAQDSIGCGLCEDTRMVDENDGTCVDCGTGGTVALVVVLLLFIGALFVKLRPLEAEYTERTPKRNLDLTFVGVPISLLADFMQISDVWSRLDVSWPKSTGSFMSGVGGVFDFNLFQLPCLLDDGDPDILALRRVIFMNLLPLFLLILIILLSVPAICARGLQKFRVPHPIVACNTALTVLVTFFITILNFSIALVFSTYEHPGLGESSLVEFRYLLTSDSEVGPLYVVAGIALFVWCGGTYFIIALCVYTLPKKTDWTLFQRCTVALVIKYFPTKSWWILLDLLVKFLVCMAVVIRKTDGEQAQWVGIVYYLYLNCLALGLPYRFIRHSMLDIVLTCCKVIVCAFAQSSIAGDNTDAVPLMIVVVFAYGFLVLNICWAFFDFFREDVSPVKDQEKFNYMRDMLGTLRPMQLHPTEMIEGQEKQEQQAKIVALQSEKEGLVAALEQKISITREDVEVIMKFTPEAKKPTLRELIQAQESVITSMKSSKDQQASAKAAEAMKEQSVMIKALLEDSGL